MYISQSKMWTLKPIKLLLFFGWFFFSMIKKWNYHNALNRCLVFYVSGTKNGKNETLFMGTAAI